MEQSVVRNGDIFLLSYELYEQNDEKDVYSTYDPKHRIE